MLIKAHNKSMSLVIYMKGKGKNLNIEFISSHRLITALSDCISWGGRLFHLSCNLALQSGFLQWPYVSNIYTLYLHSSCSPLPRCTLLRAKGTPIPSPLHRNGNCPGNFNSATFLSISTDRQALPSRRNRFDVYFL